LSPAWHDSCKGGTREGKKHPPNLLFHFLSFFLEDL
jgi:hypothetical protein